jgi:hypothetical protein
MPALSIQLFPCCEIIADATTTDYGLPALLLLLCQFGNGFLAGYARYDSIFRSRMFRERQVIDIITVHHAPGLSHGRTKISGLGFDDIFR